MGIIYLNLQNPFLSFYKLGKFTIGVVVLWVFIFNSLIKLGFL
ncbi:hypothetical protein BAZOLSSOX_362 [uncultured Gammaproteobacteria bacterium]|nr:hypothetical protein BAZOLSSOX_362 [uncultured Gammaproteobacteria bacterium]